MPSFDSSRNGRPILGEMAEGTTNSGFEYDSSLLDPLERRLWRDVCESPAAGVRSERGIALREFGPVQASIVEALAPGGMLNLILGATEPGAVESGHLAAAAEWVDSRRVDCYVPVAPGTAG